MPQKVRACLTLTDSIDAVLTLSDLEEGNLVEDLNLIVDLSVASILSDTTLFLVESNDRLVVTDDTVGFFVLNDELNGAVLIISDVIIVDIVVMDIVDTTLILTDGGL